MQKVVPMYDHLAVNTESVNVTFHHCPGYSNKKKKIGD